ncbi:WAP four-disulfide core domain protein 15A-like [Phyllostomus discolor]|uniref:WAP four-disulfide core domain protein 15A-like n=1 Tax=Phyllostomus discolor TaxID=89673 RepID=A0A7E6CGE7_9CHIR|nr:WAP four-disulfide core domain protein 15A-like [Phyllostomus discolor]
MKRSSLSALTMTFLLLLLRLHVAQPGRTKAVNKPGYCPEFTLSCPFMMLPLCHRDKGCKKSKKCCFYNCRNQCMDPWFEVETPS